MKKLSMFLLFAFAMVIASPCTHAQITEKQIKKEAKKAAKRITKEGWTLYNSSEDLYSTLINHYHGLQNEDAQELLGVASSFTSKNVGKQAAINSACNEYARQATSFLKGCLIIEWFDSDYDKIEEFDKFYTAYISVVAKDIKSVLKPSFSIIRSKGMENDREIFEMQTFFILNEKEASKVRLAAMQKAIEESESCQQYADGIAKFVQESFEIENY